MRSPPFPIPGTGEPNTILTETEEQTQPVIAFFDEMIKPLAERARAEGKSFFPLGPDPQAPTYFVEPQRKVMRPDDFELRAAESPEQFVEELAALWMYEGNGELAAMVPRLAELASAMAAQEQPDAEDLPPFIYAMF